jgi:hypothetical protein
LLGARSDTSKSQGRPLARFECPSQRTPAARTPLARTFRSVAQQELEPPAHSRLLARLSTPSPHRMDQLRVGMNLWRCSTRLSTPEPRGLDDSALDRLQLGTEDAFGSWQSGPRCSTRTADWPLIRCHEEGEGRGRVLLVQPRTRWPRWTPYTSRGKSDAARTCRFLSDDAVETSARAVATQTQTSPGSWKGVQRPKDRHVRGRDAVVGCFALGLSTCSKTDAWAMKKTTLATKRWLENRREGETAGALALSNWVAPGYK